MCDFVMDKSGAGWKGDVVEREGRRAEKKLEENEEISRR
jgi:hypothetical protein